MIEKFITIIFYLAIAYIFVIRMLKRFFLSSEFSTTIRRPVYDNTKNTSITEENNDFKDLKDLVVKQFVPIAMQMVIGIVWTFSITVFFFVWSNFVNEKKNCNSSSTAQSSMSTINANTKEFNFIESLTIFSKKYSCGTRQNYIHVNRSTCNFMFIKPKNSVNNEAVMSYEPVYAIEQEPVISGTIKNLYLMDFFKIGKKIQPDVFDDDSYSFTRIKEYESLVALIRSEYQKHAICDGVFNPDKYRFFEFCNLKNSYELFFIRIIGMYMKDHIYSISDYNREDIYCQNTMSSLYDSTISRHFVMDQLMLKFIELEVEFLKKILTELQAYAGNITDCELTIRTTDIYADSIDELSQSLCEISGTVLTEYFWTAKEVDFLYDFPFNSHWSYQVVQKYYDHLLFKGFSEKTSKVVFKLINSSNIIDNLKGFINNYIISQTTWEEFCEKLSTFNCDISSWWNFFLKNFIFDHIIEPTCRFTIDFWNTISGFFFDYKWLTAHIIGISPIIRMFYAYEYIAFSILIVYITIYIVVFLNIFFREKLFIVDYIFLVLITVLLKYAFYYFYINILLTRDYSFLSYSIFISFFIFWLFIAPNFVFDFDIEYSNPYAKDFKENPKIKSFEVRFIGSSSKGLVFFFVLLIIFFFYLYFYKKFSLLFY